MKHYFHFCLCCVTKSRPEFISEENRDTDLRPMIDCHGCTGCCHGTCNYETVAERLDAAHKEYLNLRVVTSLIHIERNKEGMPIQYVCKAEIWIGDLLKATGWAEEIVGSSPVNRTAALENCETSAVGRALANMGYQGSDPKKTRPSRTEMAKVVQRVKLLPIHYVLFRNFLVE